MKLSHTTGFECKSRLSPLFMQELPFMIREIEQEWRTQISRGSYPLRQRQYLQQAHSALATLLEIHGEVMP